MVAFDYKRTLSPTTMLNELKSFKFWRDVIVNAISSTIIMIFVILVLITNNPAAYVPSIMHFGLFAGFTIFFIIEGYGPIGGAELTPAISVGLFAAGHTTPLRMLAYIASQIGGTVVGTWIGYGLTPYSKRDNFPAIQPADELTDLQCVMVEACLAFNTLFVGLSASDYANRPAANHGLPSLSMAFCIGVGILAAGTSTGGLQSPTIPLGPSLINGKYVRHWIYWAGPISGGAAGAVSYELIRWVERMFTKKPQCENNDNVTMDQPSSLGDDCGSLTLHKSTSCLYCSLPPNGRLTEEQMTPSPDVWPDNSLSLNVRPLQMHESKI